MSEKNYLPKIFANRRERTSDQRLIALESLILELNGLRRGFAMPTRQEGVHHPRRIQQRILHGRRRAQHAGAAACAPLVFV